MVYHGFGVWTKGGIEESKMAIDFGAPIEKRQKQLISIRGRKYENN